MILRVGLICDNIRYVMTKKTTRTKLTEELKTQLRTEFVQGIELKSGERKHFSIEDLIKKYNVAPATLYRASQSEGWKALREQYNIELEKGLNIYIVIAPASGLVVIVYCEFVLLVD